MKAYTKIIIGLLFLLIFNSCITEKHFARLEDSINKKDYKTAVKILKKDKEKYGKKNRLLYYLNLGWVYHLAGDSINAEKFFEIADQTIGELFTKRISNIIASYAVNDNMLPFRAENFEKIMLSIIRTIDYSLAGRPEDARVEVMKVDNRMRFLKDQSKGQHLTYTEDAFAHYLSGLIYEMGNEDNDAYLSYLKAYKFYKKYKRKYGIRYLKKTYLGRNPYNRKYLQSYIRNYANSYKVTIPTYLKKALKRLMNEYARSVDLEMLKKELADINVNDNEEYKKNGQLVFIHYSGYAPKKVPVRLRIMPGQFGRPDIRHSIDMEFPAFKLRPHNIAYALVHVNNQTYKTELVEPIERIAVVDLTDRISGIIVKTIMRRLSKYAASKFSGKASKNKDVEEVTNILANLSEQADLRSWRTLPAEIGMIPITLSPGVYNVKVTFHASDGYTLESVNLGKIEIKSGQKVFKMYRTYR